MPKVRMKQLAAGPAGVMLAGQEYDVAGEFGSDLVSSGAAEWAGAPPREEAVAEPTETRDLSGLTKDQLVAMAERHGVEVTRADGEDGAPLKSDYVAALS